MSTITALFMNSNNGVRVYGLNQVRQWASCTNIFVTQIRKLLANFPVLNNRTSNHKQNMTCYALCAMHMMIRHWSSWIEFCMTYCSVRQRSAHSLEQLAYLESAGISSSEPRSPALSSEYRTKSLSFSPTLETASSSSGINVLITVEPHDVVHVILKFPAVMLFWMLIYLFLVCICPHFGGKCRTVDMACQFWVARRKSTSIQTLEFIQEIFCGCFWPSGIPCI